MPLRIVALNSFWLLIGTVAGRIATLTANVLAARMLGPELFGQFMTVRATVAAVENIFAGSIGNVVVKHISEGIGGGSIRLRSLIWRVVLLSTGASLVGAIAIFIVAVYFEWNSSAEVPYLRTSFFLGCLLLVVTLFSSVAIRITIGLAQFSAVALTGVAAAALSIPFIYYLTSKFGIYGALVALSLYFLLDGILKAIAIAMGVRAVGQGGKGAGADSSVRKLAKASAPLATAIAVGAITLWGVRIVAASRDNGFAEIAHFDAAYQIFTVMMVLTGVTTSLALQMFSSPVASGAQDKRKVLLTHLALNGLALAAISALVIPASREVMSVFGAEYADHHYLVPVLCAVAFIATAASVCEKLLISAAGYAYVLAANGVGALAAILSAWLMGSSNQAMVLASAYVAYYLGIAAFYALVISWQRRSLFQ